MGQRTPTTLTQARVTAVIAYEFTRTVNPSLLPPGTYPRLDRLAQRCSEIEAFAVTRPAGAVDAADPPLPS